jgi:hypothetical protein
MDITALSGTISTNVLLHCCSSSESSSGVSAFVRSELVTNPLIFRVNRTHPTAFSRYFGCSVLENRCGQDILLSLRGLDGV